MDRHYPAIAELPPQQRPEAMFPKLFGTISAPPALADLLPLVRTWRPQLVINDAAELASPIAGIPQLCLPQAADQFLNASAIARAGAGISIAPQDVSAAGVALAIRRLLDDDGYRSAARRVAGEIAAMPSPDEVAAHLEALV